MNNLLLAGEFARLARTTKRTVIWYDQKGILEPYKTLENGYRYYVPRQIIDYQVVSLLRQLNFSISDIQLFLKNSKSLKTLFKTKRNLISGELKKLRLKLNSIEEYYRNLEGGDLLVKPKIVAVKQCLVIYFDRMGSYAKIKDYCLELKDMIGARVAKMGLFYTAFYERAYRPKNAKMQIGLKVGGGEERAVQRLLNDFRTIAGLHFATVPSHKALVHIHRGSGRFNSLLWNHLATFMKRKKLLPHPDILHREIYNKTSLNGYPDEDEHVFELQRPLTTKQ
ncbi:MAG: MerR family transcriptional regulator [Candidatus Dojkabacteria bacterium]|nr:MerR family transcriptional regulator [Candidatus Dojkabacteria bacterium]